MNNCFFIGRLTSDIEVKQTMSGIPVCSFCLAVERPNAKDATDFINFVAWRHNAEFIGKYFSKGQKVAVNGILTSRKFQDKNGNNHVAFEVVVDRAEFCESRKKDDSVPAAQEHEPNMEEVKEPDDLPF